MIEWCGENKVKINEEKTHVIFNEARMTKFNTENATIRTTHCIKYLGAELIANKAENKSTFLICTEGVANKIKQRCRAIKALRKYKIPEKQFIQACLAFIGGKLNYHAMAGRRICYPANNPPIRGCIQRVHENVHGVFSDDPDTCTTRCWSG